jgi:hypothetical protein
MRKTSTHLVVGVHNATALPPIHLGSNAYPGVWGFQPPNWVPPAGSWMAPQGGPWMPQQGGGWMVPGPQYMQPAAMVEAPIHAHLTQDSAVRGSRRRKRKVLDDTVQGRTSAGQKPHTLRVKASGEIARGYEGKNAWDAIVRTNVPRTLDIGVLSWKEQSLDAIAELRTN